MKFIDEIVNSEQTVWSIAELRLFLWIKNTNTMWSFLQRMKKNNILFCPYRGIWCRKDFDYLELWAKIKSKSYISLQTVLQRAGIIFQDRSHTITVVSDNTLTIKLPSLKLSVDIHKIKKSIFTNPLFIINTWTYQIASTERAVCDMLYFDPKFYFDHTSSLDVEKLQELSEIYDEKTKKSILSLILHINDGK